MKSKITFIKANYGSREVDQIKDICSRLQTV